MYPWRGFLLFCTTTLVFLPSSRANGTGKCKHVSYYLEEETLLSCRPGDRNIKCPVIDYPPPMATGENEVCIFISRYKGKSKKTGFTCTTMDSDTNIDAHTPLFQLTSSYVFDNAFLKKRESKCVHIKGSTLCYCFEKECNSLEKIKELLDSIKDGKKPLEMELLKAEEYKRVQTAMFNEVSIFPSKFSYNDSKAQELNGRLACQTVHMNNVVEIKGSNDAAKPNLLETSTQEVSTTDASSPETTTVKTTTTTVASTVQDDKCTHGEYLYKIEDKRYVTCLRGEGEEIKECHVELGSAQTTVTNMVEACVFLSRYVPPTAQDKDYTCSSIKDQALFEMTSSYVRASDFTELQPSCAHIKGSTVCYCFEKGCNSLESIKKLLEKLLDDGANMEAVSLTRYNTILGHLGIHKRIALLDANKQELETYEYSQMLTCHIGHMNNILGINESSSPEEGDVIGSATSQHGEVKCTQLNVMFTKDEDYVVCRRGDRYRGCPTEFVQSLPGSIGTAADTTLCVSIFRYDIKKPQRDTNVPKCVTDNPSTPILETGALTVDAETAVKIQSGCFYIMEFAICVCKETNCNSLENLDNTMYDEMTRRHIVEFNYKRLHGILKVKQLPSPTPFSEAKRQVISFCMYGRIIEALHPHPFAKTVKAHRSNSKEGWKMPRIYIMRSSTTEKVIAIVLAAAAVIAAIAGPVVIVNMWNSYIAAAYKIRSADMLKLKVLPNKKIEKGTEKPIKKDDKKKKKK